MKHAALLGALLLVALCAPAVARADSDEPSANGSTYRPGFRPTVVTDVRFATLIRSNDAYFSEADTFGYPISRAAIGIEGNVGVELVPRLSLAIGAGYYGSGASRRNAKLMLTSESVSLLAKYAALRWQTPDGDARLSLEVTVGVGRYWIRETYTDPSLFSTAFVTDGASMGGSGGVDLTADIYALRLVLGYAYHYAPATIANEIGGVARAGGHIIDVGVGARF